MPVIAFAIPKHSMASASPFALGLIRWASSWFGWAFSICIGLASTISSLLATSLFALSLLCGMILERKKVMPPVMPGLAAQLAFYTGLGRFRAT